MAARTAEVVGSNTGKARKPKKQAGSPEKHGKDKTRQAERTGEQRLLLGKPAGRPHPEAPPRPHPSPPRRQALLSEQDQASSKPVPLTQARALQELVRRAGEGNEDCLRGLRDLLDKTPALWEAAGNVAALAERAWIELLACDSKLIELSIPRKLKELKAELAGKYSSPLETLLIDVVAVAWLAAQQGEIAASRQDGSTQQTASRLKRAESGQRRLLNAAKTLAVVRALLPRALPSLERDKQRPRLCKLRQ